MGIHYIYIYPQVMTNSLPWKDSQCLIGKPSISMGHLYHGKLLVITRGYILGARLLQQKRDPVLSSGENDVSFQLAPTHCTAAFGNPISCIWRRTKGPRIHPVFHSI